MQHVYYPFIFYQPVEALSAMAICKERIICHINEGCHHSFCHRTKSWGTIAQQNSALLTKSCIEEFTERFETIEDLLTPSSRRP
jgi:hypothetical protein